jgi:hypothetical protein
MTERSTGHKYIKGKSDNIILFYLVETAWITYMINKV